MEKEQSSKIEENINDKSVTSEQSKDDEKSKKEEVELTPAEKIKELEEKLVRTLAEMENQRRRFEKEKDDAFGRVNIYEDYFDEKTGLYHYIGEGQVGDQTLDSGSGGNKRIVKAKNEHI